MPGNSQLSAHPDQHGVDHPSGHRLQYSAQQGHSYNVHLDTSECPVGPVSRLQGTLREEELTRGKVVETNQETPGRLAPLPGWSAVGQLLLSHA